VGVKRPAAEIAGPSIACRLAKTFSLADVSLLLRCLVSFPMLAGLGSRTKDPSSQRY
jgi:hypothetical protein